jgi:RNA polymerase sigma-70 factor (ECF subfamily)
LLSGLERVTQETVRPLPFEEVYEQYRAAVYRFCLTQVRDAAVAEDIGADVFEAAFKAYERARPEPDSVRFWLFRIAKNRVINYHRRNARWRAIAGLLHRTAEGGADVEDTATIRADLRVALQSLSGLKARDRELVGLRAAGGLSFQEIAELTGMTEHAAIVATRRAFERVREAVRSNE